MERMLRRAGNQTPASLQHPGATVRALSSLLVCTGSLIDAAGLQIVDTCRDEQVRDRKKRSCWA